MPYTSDSWTFGHVPTTFKRLPTVNRWGVLHGFYSDQRDDQELSNSAPDMPSGVGFRILANRNIWRFPNSRGGSPYVHTTNVTAGSGAISWDIQNGDNILQTYTQPNQKACANISLNLQNGNALFGASTTVQPAGLYSLFLIRAYQA